MHGVIRVIDGLTSKITVVNRVIATGQKVNVAFTQISSTGTSNITTLSQPNSEVNWIFALSWNIGKALQLIV